MSDTQIDCNVTALYQFVFLQLLATGMFLPVCHVDSLFSWHLQLCLTLKLSYTHSLVPGMHVLVQTIRESLLKDFQFLITYTLYFGLGL